MVPMVATVVVVMVGVAEMFLVPLKEPMHFPLPYAVDANTLGNFGMACARSTYTMKPWPCRSIAVDETKGPLPLPLLLELLLELELAGRGKAMPQMGPETSLSARGRRSVFICDHTLRPRPGPPAAPASSVAAGEEDEEGAAALPPTPCPCPCALSTSYTKNALSA